MIRVLIVDDEPVARRGLARMLRAEPDLEVAGEAADGEEAVRVLREKQVDLVFLDIRMPGPDGLAIAESLESVDRPPLIVFVTAFDEYAVRAFEVDAADYVLKPFDRDRLRQALDRARRRLRREALDRVQSGVGTLERLLGRTADATPDRLVVREAGNVFFLRPDEIDWVESAANYVRLHAGRDTHLVRDTLAAMEQRLEPHGFLRISRSVLVNLDRVRKVQPGGGGTHVAILDDGRRLAVSRRSGRSLRRAIERLQ